MKDRLCLDFNYIFNDHMAKCSDQAKLYYIKLMFFANNGFVANPMEVLDSMGYDKSVFYELVANEELRTLPGREEVFITAYFIHTHFNSASWLDTPFATYWKGRLYTKPNGVATFKAVPSGDEQTLDEADKRSTIIKKTMSAIVELQNDKHPAAKQVDWDTLLDDLDSIK